MTTDLDRAFTRLDTFLTKRLPIQIRLLRIRTSLHPRRHADILDDLRQTLALDCAEHAAEILKLDDARLWQRWHRLAQREHYTLRGRRMLSLEGAPPPLAHEATTAELETLSPKQEKLLRAAQKECVLLKNGRVSLGATAQRIDIHPRILRGLWDRLTEELDLGEEHTYFWCNRFAEALLDLVAADLEQSGVVVPTNSREPEWLAFRHRFRRIRRALAVRRQPQEIRDALLQLGPRHARSQPPAEQLLQAAELVAPQHPRLAPIRARLRERSRHRADSSATPRMRVSMRLRSAYSHCE